MDINTTFTNGRVALADDLVFGVVVLTDTGWYPVASLIPDERDIVLEAVDNNPTCPQRFIDALRM